MISLLFYSCFFSDYLQSIENNWRQGRHNLQRINCRSENSKGVYCLQYDDHKIVSGLRDNTIKIWDRFSLQCVKILTGHTGSVLCLQYDDKVRNIVFTNFFRLVLVFDSGCCLSSKSNQVVFYCQHSWYSCSTRHEYFVSFV